MFYVKQQKHKTVKQKTKTVNKKVFLQKDKENRQTSHHTVLNV